MKKILILLLLALAYGCSVAPVSVTNTARSLGEKNNQVTFNAPVWGAMYERGLTQKLDFGVGAEEQVGPVFSGFLKYAFLNNQEKGFSFAEIIGGSYGPSLGKSTAIYFSPIVSYRHDWFETFLAYRINYVHWKNDISSDHRDDLISYIPRSTSFHYHQMDVGFNFIGEKWTTSVGAKFFMFDKNASGIPFLSLGYKF